MALHEAFVPTSVLGAAARWARRFAISRRAFASCLEECRVSEVEALRVRVRCHRRWVVARFAPTDSRQRKVEEAINASAFDPWQVQTATLREETRQLVGCPTCGGGKQIRCPTCGGGAVVTCGDCAGHGRVVSARTGKWIQCRGCRATGRRRCACRDGRVRCPQCAGKGRLERWLEVEDSVVEHVTVAGSPLLTTALGRGSQETSPPDAPPPTARWWFDWNDEPRTEMLDEALALFRPFGLTLPVNRPDERYRDLLVERFEGKASELRYRVAGNEGRLQVRHWDLGVVAEPSSETPFRRRLWRLFLVAAACFAVAGAVAAWYSLRHPFFMTTPRLPWLWALALAAAVLTLPVTAASCLPTPSHRLRSRLLALLPAALLAVQVVLAGGGGPSYRGALQQAEAGEVDAALLEATACVELGVDTERATALHDRLLLQRAGELDDPTEAWRAAAGPFLTDEARRTAVESAYRLTVRQARRRLDFGDPGEAWSVLRRLPAEHRSRPQHRPLRIRIAVDDLSVCVERRSVNCSSQRLSTARGSGLADGELDEVYGELRQRHSLEAAGEWADVRSPAASLESRIESCRKLRGLLTQLDARRAEAGWRPSVQQVSEACSRLTAEQERRRAAELNRQEAAQRNSRRAWASAPLRCRDGTLSPSCVCGQSSRRGCCSHHGGVAGCSASL